MFHQRSSITLLLATRLRTKVHKVKVLSTLAEHALFGLVQKGKEFLEAANSTFAIQLEEEFPHSGPEDGKPVIHVLAWWHPVPVSSLFYCCKMM